MAQIQITCPRCGGTGIEPDTESDECVQCEGAGIWFPNDFYGKQLAFAEKTSDQLDDMTDKIDDVMDKCNDIMEKLNE